MAENVRPGDALIMAGVLAASGTARLIESGVAGAEFREYAADIPLLSEEQISFSDCYIKAVSRGGVLRTLWDIKKETGLGFNVALSDIPARQETIEICERLDINPFYLEGDGAYIIVTGDEERVLDECGIRHIPAAVIGHMKAGAGEIVRSGEVSFIERPKKDPYQGLFAPTSE
ncbi:MAG: hypothetical protein IKN24_07445 [Lachnospiraceae bacterium]|nr:hypothetical protein [Lachnospiraceae bacterium]